MDWGGQRATYAYLAVGCRLRTPTEAPTGINEQQPNVAYAQPVLVIEQPPGVPMPSSHLGGQTLGHTTLGASRPPQIGAFFRDTRARHKAGAGFTLSRTRREQTTA